MNKDIADVCIIGAGLAGGIVAYELASKGVRVVILEAGPRHDPRARFSYMEESLNGKDPWASNNPERDVYTNAGEIKYPLNKMRVKAVGGSTLHWGGVALRLHETDFQMNKLYGLADDWPISYEEIEPYYGKAEIALGVSGIADNPFATYRSSDFPLPAFPFSYSDKLFKTGCDKLGIVMHHVPVARNSTVYQNRPACQAFATCESHGICPIIALYSAEVHVRLAERTGNARVIADANVLRLNVDNSGKVISATYAKPDRTEHEQRGRVFVLAAHSVESARLLLLSKSSQFPHGLANSSGMVGKNFMEHLYILGQGKLKERTFPYRIGFHTAESHQFCVSKKRDEIGAIKLEFLNLVGLKPYQIAQMSDNWGVALEEEIRESFGRDVKVAAEIEHLPDERSSISLDQSVKDCFGNPAPCITLSIGDYEKRACEKAVEIIEKILDVLGATQIEWSRQGRFGFAAHHMGTCRMGEDPERSVVDSNLKAHDVDNLYVVGSSTFVTAGPYQPSLTIAALAIRAAEFILKKSRYQSN